MGAAIMLWMHLPPANVLWCSVCGSSHVFAEAQACSERRFVLKIIIKKNLQALFISEELSESPQSVPAL